MQLKHYNNGQWVNQEGTTVSAFDLTVLRGYGAFDYLRTYSHVPLYLEEHVSRFFRSADLLGIEYQYDKDDVLKIVREGLKLNKNGELDIRMLFTGGVSEDHISPGKARLLVLFEEFKPYPEEYFSKGIKVITWPVPRNTPEAKSINYHQAIGAIKQARSKGAVEALHVDPEHVSPRLVYEATTSNVFIVEGEKLITPESGILYGITRGVIINLAKEMGLSVEERELTTAELLESREAFISASNKEVMPVVGINDHTIGDGKPGQTTRRLQKAYHDKIDEYVEKNKL